MNPHVNLRVTRLFRSPAERAFVAWLDPAMIAQFMFGPALRDEEILRIALDAHVGGTFSFLVRRNGQEINHVGTYLGIDRPQRLVFTWAVGQQSADDDRVMIDVVPLEAGCELTLTHQLHPDWQDHARQIEASWSKMLDALGGLID